MGPDKNNLRQRRVGFKENRLFSVAVHKAIAKIKTLEQNRAWL
jgi:hypothetical protein